MDHLHSGGFNTNNGGDVLNNDRSSLLSSLRSEREALLLRALQQRSGPAPSAAAAVYPGLAASSTQDDARLRALLFLQASQVPSAAAASLSAPQAAHGHAASHELLDLQSLSRLRTGSAAAGLLAPAEMGPPQQLSQVDFLRQLRTNSLLNVRGAASTDFYEQARILHAYNSHQHALASASEAERRLNVLLGGGSASLSSNNSNNTNTPPAMAAAVTHEGDCLDHVLGSSKPAAKMCLPPIEEGNTPHYSQRLIVPLGMEEDPNWLSERQCFIRSELLEVIRASHEEVLVRSSSKSIAYQQVGIRCRYCAHLPAGSRAIRASAFPSSIRQMYQSFTMMVRDHFGNCSGIPADKKQRFLKLKGLTSPSSSLSRQYWTFAAKKLGMVDSEFGIMINEQTQAEAAKIPPFGTSLEETKAIQAERVELMVQENDQNGISSYLYFLMSQAQVVHLLPSERVGKRKDAAVGLPGFGCKYCATNGRLGFCRMFPLNKRSLPDKVNDLYNHMIRCPNCPRMTKRLLESRKTEQEANRVFAERDRDFIDRIWIKLGRDADEAFKKA